MKHDYMKRFLEKEDDPKKTKTIYKLNKREDLLQFLKKMRKFEKEIEDVDSEEDRWWTRYYDHLDEYWLGYWIGQIEFFLNFCEYHSNDFEESMRMLMISTIVSTERELALYVK